jgi:hypothetical protein
MQCGFDFISATLNNRAQPPCNNKQLGSLSEVEMTLS